MTQSVQTEEGRIDRLVYGRIAPNEDLVQGLQAICQAQGVRHALVRVGLGSLVDARLEAPSGRHLFMAGPAVEVLSLFGEVRTEADGTCSAALCGVVVDAAGQVLSGRFVSGHNLVFATFEVTLEEWLPHVSTAAPMNAL